MARPCRFPVKLFGEKTGSWHIIGLIGENTDYVNTKKNCALKSVELL